MATGPENDRMSTRRLAWKIKDLLTEWGWMRRRAAPYRRLPAGAVRDRLSRQGTVRRLRRVSLQRLLTN